MAAKSTSQRQRGARFVPPAKQAPGLTGRWCCAGCDKPRAETGAPNPSKDLCEHCDQRVGCVFVLAAGQYVAERVLLPVGYRPWPNACGQWRCAQCQLKREPKLFTAGTVSFPPPCPHCGEYTALPRWITPGVPLARPPLATRRIRTRGRSTAIMLRRA